MTPREVRERREAVRAACATALPQLRWTKRGWMVHGRGLSAHVHFHIDDQGRCSRIALSRRDDLLISLAEVPPPPEVTPAAVVARVRQAVVRARRQLVRDEACINECGVFARAATPASPTPRRMPS